MQESNHNPYDDQQGYDAPTLPYTPYETTQPQEERPVESGFPYASVPEASTSYPPAVSGYPPLYPYPMAAMPAPSEMAPSRKRGSVLWIVLGAIVAVAIIGSASFFGLSYLNRSTPTKTLDTFCKALQDGQYQQAYDQFSKKFQQNLAQNSISESDFAMILGQDKVNTCTHGVAAETGTSTTTTLKLVHQSQGINNDRVTLMKDGTGYWRIDDLQGA